MHPDVCTNQVAQREWAHRHAKVSLDDLVHLVDVETQVGQHASSHTVREETPVHSKACAVADDHRDLADGGAKLQRVQNHLTTGALCAHNLQQRHDVGGAEEVRPDKTVSGAGLLPNQGDIDGGGVAGQNAVRTAGSLQVSKDLLLEGDVLQSCLNDHVGTLEIAVVQGALDEAKHKMRLLLLHPPLLHSTHHIRLDAVHAGLEELLVDLLQNDTDASKRSSSADAGPHQAAADDGDALDWPGLQTLISHALHLFGGPLSKEDVHQGFVGVQCG
mmetsp:Transcript_20088/g.50616  ORF Transcript_20088/g.50616 Transcript_20088/m.50616 type:complete len:274 (-) Transcript_20088:1028-1849(-)